MHHHRTNSSWFKKKTEIKKMSSDFGTIVFDPTCILRRAVSAARLVLQNTEVVLGHVLLTAVRSGKIHQVLVPRTMSMFGSFGNLFGASGPSLCADIGEPVDTRTSFGGWSHFRGTIKEDGGPCSVFKFVGNVNTDRVRIETARNGAKRLKLTRHPNVVHLKESLEVEKGDELTIYVVTEFVMPLLEHLKSVPAGTHQRDEYFALGLRQVATAVSFLSNDCSLVHGGVSMAAVFVTDRLDWKLGGLDLVSDLVSIGRGPNGDARICHSSHLIPDQYKPEEYRKGDWAVVPQGPPWAIDAWGMVSISHLPHSAD